MTTNEEEDRIDYNPYASKKLPVGRRWTLVPIITLKIKGPLTENVIAFLQDSGFKKDEKEGYWWRRKGEHFNIVKFSRMLDSSHPDYDNYTPLPKPIQSNEFNYKVSGNEFVVTFKGIPDETVRNILKGNGFYFNPTDKTWRTDSANSKAFGVLNHLGKEHNPKKPDAPCWKCKSPDGYFRNMGAATPVYCDKCWNERKQSSLCARIIKLANRLDKIGLVKEADMIDRIIYAIKQWTKEDVLNDTPKVEVIVDDDPSITHGRIIHEGNNPWIEVTLKNGKTRAKRFSWDAILQALNSPRDHKLPIDRQEKSWRSPGETHNR